MGRKPLPEDEKRHKPLRIRLKDEEREIVDAGAEAAGFVTTSRWARDVLLEAAQKEITAKKRRRKKR